MTLKVDTIIVDSGGCLCCPNGTEFPEGAIEGNFFYRTDENKLYQYDGSTWKGISQCIPVTNTVHVDIKRTDDYTADGSGNFWKPQTDTDSGAAARGECADSPIRQSGSGGISFQ